MHQTVEDRFCLFFSKTHIFIKYKITNRRRRTGHDQKEKSLQSEATAVEHFAHVCRTHQARFANVIGQHSTERHNDRHYQMRKCSQKSKLYQIDPKKSLQSNPWQAIMLNFSLYLGDLELKPMLQKWALVQHQHVEVPRATEIGHHNGVHRQWSTYVGPGRRGDCGHRLLNGFAQWFFNVL